MAALIDSIGVVSGALGIVSFLQDNLPSDPAEGAAIKVKAGLANDDDPGMGGEVSAAYAWDTNNNYLGKADGEEIKTGDIAEITIDSSSPGTAAEYVAVSTGDDAVCVAWITVANHDGSLKGGAWTGDIGYKCDQHWYQQDEAAGKIPDSNDDYIPHCTWLDADHTGDTPSAAVKFKTRAYGEAVKDTVDSGDPCKFTKFGPDDGPIADPIDKRAPRPRQPWMEERLIVSNRKQHKAEELCSSGTSWGPDFVGTDGMFCDMGTKTLSPLCSTRDVDGCVNVDEEGNRVTKRSLVAKRSVDMDHKTYTKINTWG